MVVQSWRTHRYSSSVMMMMMMMMRVVVSKSNKMNMRREEQRQRGQTFSFPRFSFSFECTSVLPGLMFDDNDQKRTRIRKKKEKNNEFCTQLNSRSSFERRKKEKKSPCLSFLLHFSVIIDRSYFEEVFDIPCTRRTTILNSSMV